jgi:hypothetical protein
MLAGWVAPYSFLCEDFVCGNGQRVVLCVEMDRELFCVWKWTESCFVCGNGQRVVLCVETGRELFCVWKRAESCFVCANGQSCFVCGNVGKRVVPRVKLKPCFDGDELGHIERLR